MKEGWTGSNGGMSGGRTIGSLIPPLRQAYSPGFAEHLAQQAARVGLIIHHQHPQAVEANGRQVQRSRMGRSSRWTNLFLDMHGTFPPINFQPFLASNKNRAIFCTVYLGLSVQA
jgi:hypothetical protein